MSPLSSHEIRKAVRAALDEDIGSGDVTTLATVSPGTVARAHMVARTPLVLAGLAFAEIVFREISPRVTIRALARDGQHVARGARILSVTGPACALLTAERVALNFVQRLSGVASVTARYVDAVKDTGVKILDTRKTTPGWRRFEKYAVLCGGGVNHRFGLFDLILIKDNHLAALKDGKPNPIAAAVRLARAKFPRLKIEVEADTLRQAADAAEAGADIILLDNMTPRLLRQAVKVIAQRAHTEASGGVTLKTIRAIAKTGVDYISVGALTHSAPAVDIALDFDA